MVLGFAAQGCANQEKKEKVFVRENMFSGVSGCFALKIVNFTAVMDVTFLHLSAITYLNICLYMHRMFVNIKL